jgi:RNA polymerase sigma-70 factor (ECF subfamily)
MPPVDETALAGLAAAAVAGERLAVDALLTELRPRILRYCLARLRRPDVADDVTQEVCLAVTTGLSRYRGEGGGVLAFAFGIASHKVADAQRAAGRRPVPTDALPERSDPAAGPEECAVRGSEIDRLHVALSRLPEQGREILLMRMSGLSAQECGDAIGLAPGAVRVAQHRALARLRLLLTTEVSG